MVPGIPPNLFYWFRGSYLDLVSGVPYPAVPLPPVDCSVHLATHGNMNHTPQLLLQVINSVSQYDTACRKHFKIWCVEDFVQVMVYYSKNYLTIRNA